MSALSQLASIAALLPPLAVIPKEPLVLLDDGVQRAAQIVFTERYSQKSRTATEKMATQLQCAIRSPSTPKIYRNSFVVQPPSCCFEINEICPGYTYRELEVGIAQAQGTRDHQEDNYLLATPIVFQWKGSQIEAQIFGVFDGHGDNLAASTHIKAHLKGELERIFLQAAVQCDGPLTEEIITNALMQLFANLARTYQANPQNVGGTTVTCAFVMKHKIYLVNIGDSRALLVTPEKVHQLTEDAILSNERFTKWHIDRRHRVFLDRHGTYRVSTGTPQKDLSLMMGRDVGADPGMCHRAKITSLLRGEGRDKPSQGTLYTDRKKRFLVLSTDGLFEVATKMEVAEAVRALTTEHIPLQEAAQLIADKANAYPEVDNITVMIVAL